MNDYVFCQWGTNHPATPPARDLIWGHPDAAPPHPVPAIVLCPAGKKDLHVNITPTLVIVSIFLTKHFCAHYNQLPTRFIGLSLSLYTSG